MDEMEAYTKLAYEAYMHDAYGSVGSTFSWEKLNQEEQKHWQAAIKRLLEAMETSLEASE